MSRLVKIKKNQNIYVYGRGRFGNILFENLVCRYYAKKHNMKPYIIKGFLTDDLIRDYTNTSLLCDIEIAEAPNDDCIEFNEKDAWTYSEIPYQKGKDIKINGYLQNCDYWENDKQFAINLYKISEDEIREVKKIYSDINLHNTVCLHIRRTDFITVFKDWVNTKEYVEGVIKTYLPDEDKFIIVSDDYEWCRENFKEDKYVIGDRESDFLQKFMVDFITITQCKHVIINNGSTFSWWGAYLNQVPERKVFYSSKIMNEPGMIPKNDNWIDTKIG